MPACYGVLGFDRFLYFFRMTACQAVLISPKRGAYAQKYGNLAISTSPRNAAQNMESSPDNNTCILYIDAIGNSRRSSGGE
jgi:hypothetical protein